MILLIDNLDSKDSRIYKSIFKSKSKSVNLKSIFRFRFRFYRFYNNRIIFLKSSVYITKQKI